VCSIFIPIQLGGTSKVNTCRHKTEAGRDPVQSGFILENALHSLKLACSFYEMFGYSILLKNKDTPPTQIHTKPKSFCNAN